MFGKGFSNAPFSSQSIEASTSFIAPAFASAVATAQTNTQTQVPAVASAVSSAVVNIISVVPAWASADTSASVDIVVVDTVIGLTPVHAEVSTSALVGRIAGEVVAATPDVASVVASATLSAVIGGTLNYTPVVASAAATAYVAATILSDQKLISLHSYIHHYTNFVAYQTESGDIRISRGFGPSEPTTSSAGPDTVISIESYIKSLNNYVVYENGRGEIMVGKAYGPPEAITVAATEIAAIFSYETAGGTQVVVTENGAGVIKLSKNPQ